MLETGEKSVLEKGERMPMPMPIKIHQNSTELQTHILTTLTHFYTQLLKLDVKLDVLSQ